MSYMFLVTTVFNQDIGNWDVSNVTDMSGMFNSSPVFNQDIGSWDVSSVTDMSKMFSYATVFNQDIGNWDVSNVTDMSEMFVMSEDFNQNLTNWCVINIPTEPNYFSFGSDMSQSNHPIWGTCPNISVSENEIGSELNVFPNPTKDILYVQAPENSSLILVDINGKTIRQLTTERVETSIDMSSYAQGIYVLQILIGEAVETRMIVRK
jgi:surface protein